MKWLALFVLVAGSSDAYAGSVCRDGTYSSSSGRGACSHHGGVARPASIPESSSHAARPSPAPSPSVERPPAPPPSPEPPPTVEAPASNPSPKPSASPRAAPKHAATKEPVPQSQSATQGDPGPTPANVDIPETAPWFLGAVLSATGGVGILGCSGILLAGILAAVAWSASAAKQREAAAEEQRAAEEAHEAQVAAFLEEIEPNPIALLSAAIDENELRDIFKPQKGEQVLSITMVDAYQAKSVVSGAVYGGLSVSKKLVGPLRLRVGAVKAAPIRREVVSPVGSGALLITTKRVVFNAAGNGKNWSRTWASIISVGALDRAVVFDLSSGRPMIFAIRAEVPNAGVFDHPASLLAIAEAAHDARRT